MRSSAWFWGGLMALGTACGSSAGPGFEVDAGGTTDAGTTEASTGGDATSTGSRTCTPGQQVSCACAGGASGVQVCASDGSGFGPCTGCTSGSSSGSGSGSGSGGCVPLSKSQVCADGGVYCGAHTDGCGGTVDCGSDCGATSECACNSNAGYCCLPWGTGWASCTQPGMSWGGVQPLCGTTKDFCGCATTCPPSCAYGTCQSGACTCWRYPGWDANCANYKYPPNAVVCSSAGGAPASGCTDLTGQGEAWCCP